MGLDIEKVKETGVYQALQSELVATLNEIRIQTNGLPSRYPLAKMKIDQLLKECDIIYAEIVAVVPAVKTEAERILQEQFNAKGEKIEVVLGD